MSVSWGSSSFFNKRTPKPRSSHSSKSANSTRVSEGVDAGADKVLSDVDDGIITRFEAVKTLRRISNNDDGRLVVRGATLRTGSASALEILLSDKSAQLDELVLQDVRVSGDAMLRLTSGLRQCDSLIKFTFTNSALTDETAGDVARAISHLPALETLDLSDNNIAGLLFLNNLHNASIKTLTLDKNPVASASLTDAVAYISGWSPQLEFLSMKNTPLVKEHGNSDFLRAALKNRSEYFTKLRLVV